MIGKSYQILTTRLSESLVRAGLEITVPEYLILRVLYSNDGIQQCEIASILGRDKAAICRCIKEMTAKDLVTVQPLSRKCLKVFLSGNARAIEPVILSVAEERHKALTSLLTQDELTVFIKTLNKILHN